jgi:hypothetical protein
MAQAMLDWGSDQRFWRCGWLTRPRALPERSAFDKRGLRLANCEPQLI